MAYNQILIPLSTNNVHELRRVYGGLIIDPGTQSVSGWLCRRPDFRAQDITSGIRAQPWPKMWEQRGFGLKALHTVLDTRKSRSEVLAGQRQKCYTAEDPLGATYWARTSNWAIYRQTALRVTSRVLLYLGRWSIIGLSLNEDVKDLVWEIVRTCSTSCRCET